MYFKTVETVQGRAITLITMLDIGSDIVSAKSLKSIVQAIRLDVKTLERAYSGQYRRRDYEAHLLKVLR